MTIGISPTEREMESTSEYAQGMMGHGKLIKNQLSKMLPRIEQQPILIVLLNQVYTSMDRYGNSKLVSGGGYGLKHNAHLRVEFRGGKNEGDDDKTPLFITSKLSEINLEKSKISPLFKGIPFVIDVTKGGVVDPLQSMLVFSRDRRDYIQNAGGWCQLNSKIFEWYPEYDNKFDKYCSTGARFRFSELEEYIKRRPKFIKFLQLCFLKEISDMYSYQAEICKPYIAQLKKEMEEPEPERQVDGTVVDLWTGQSLSSKDDNAKIDAMKDLIENLD